MVAISQVTELGTCYTLDELKVLREFCQAEGLRLYVDGARLANAAAHLGCSLADLAAHADVLSFGGTKNGAVGAEAVVVMAEELAAGAPFLRKQQTQLASKMRYLSAQFLGLLEDELWLRNARSRERHGRPARGRDPGRAGRGTVAGRGVQCGLRCAWIRPTLRGSSGVRSFYEWDASAHVVRWMTAFDTTEADVDAFVADVRRTAGSG